MTSNLTRVTVGLLDPHECDVLGSIFFNAVHKGAKAFYSDKQCQAWAPSIPSGQDWAGRLMSQRTIVARLEGEPIGFMTLDDTGYIDLAFVDPDYQRQGVGQKLYDRIEDMARADGIKRLHANASYLVKGLFERNGWSVLRKQQVTRSTVTLTNFFMEKSMS